MFRKLRDQAERLNISIGTMRGLLRHGLAFSQVPTGTIYISDSAVEDFFRRHEKMTTVPVEREVAESIAKKVL